MDINDLYIRYNPWWDKETDFINAYERKTIISKIDNLFENKNIIILTGLRRVGKTTLMKLIIKKLIEEKMVSPSDIFYVSLDDILLDNNSILEIIEVFRKIHRHSLDKKIYVFLDEITYKQQFHRQLKNLYDRENIKIYASSSSASVLKDKSAFLTGRERVIEILPFTFEEYMDLKRIKIKNRDKFLINNYFEEFLKTGGMPEYIITKDRAYINSLIEDILKKDIIFKKDVRNPEIIKDFFLLLMNHSSGILSIYKIAKTLRISTETAYRYFDYFLDTFLINKVKRCGRLNQKVNSPSKIYVSDIGIRYLFSEGKRLGKQFENYAYLELKDYDLCYLYENSTEIDFLINKENLVEIKYEGTLNKKQKALFDEYTVKNKYIIKNFEQLKQFKKRLSKK